MMARGHSATGAAAVAMFGLIPGLISSDILLAISILVGAGAGLWPDWDHTKATAATTFGWFSKTLAYFIENGSQFIYATTRRGRDAKRSGGHRTFTHTFLFAGLSGIGVYFASSNEIAKLSILFVMLCLGLRGLFPVATTKGRKRKLGSFLWFLYMVASLIPLAIYMHKIPTIEPIVLAVTVAIGTAVHSLGDCLTNSGAPLLFPLPIHGQLWYRFKAPARFSTGSELGKKIEYWIKIGCTIIIAAVFIIRFGYGSLVNELR